ncbi:caspase family protein [Lyngbya aestuarii]|uniref:caspase family protein n=1 Tax=Lyngbya aestuarii TaxID=118322 RepID=UPI00403D63AC
MTRKIYALLVGIDHYPSPISPLKGCVNDITTLEAYLRGRVTQEGDQLNLLKLQNQEATRQAIIEGFRQHLGQAESQDVALFYYSGRGSQEKSPPEFCHLEPNRLHETLVCWDSRTAGNWDLADKELTQLIAEVAQKNPQITIILDCSTSCGGFDHLNLRCLPLDERERPLDSYIVSRERVGELLAARSLEKNSTGWSILPQGRQVLLAASREWEAAQEFWGDGKHQGAFSYFFMDILRQANTSLTYRELFRRAAAMVHSQVGTQSPQIAVSNSSELDQHFLGGAIASQTSYFNVSHHPTHGWVINGGAAQGIPQPSDTETTWLKLFPLESTSEQLHQLIQAIGEAEVTQVLPQLSEVRLRGVADLAPEMTFKAVIISLPLPALDIWLEGEATGRELARQALQEARPEGQPSLYLRETSELTTAAFCLLAENGQYLITKPRDHRPLTSPITGYTPQTALQAIQYLEHIARWTNTAQLFTPATGSLPADAVQIQIYQDDQEIEDSQISLTCKYENGQWQQPSFRVKLTNTSQERLYCTLLGLTESYAVNPALLPGVWLPPGEEIWTLNGQPAYLQVPQDLWEQGITERQNLLKLIVSTAEFDSTLLQQGKLDQPHDAREPLGATRGPIGSTMGLSSTTLNRLMRRVSTRELSIFPEGEEYCGDWYTSQLTITTVYSRPMTPVPQGGEGVSLGARTQLQPHPSLQAVARLTTLSQVSQGLGNLMLPAILRQDPAVAQAFKFSSGRGTDPGLSILELSNVENPTVVTPEEPLVLWVDAPLRENEQLLAIAYSGESFLTLGRGQAREHAQAEIKLEQLPEPLSKGQHHPQGSILIFFAKLVAQKLARDSDQPVSATADLGVEEQVTDETNTTPMENPDLAETPAEEPTPSRSEDTPSEPTSGRGLQLGFVLGIILSLAVAMILGRLLWNRAQEEPPTPPQQQETIAP